VRSAYLRQRDADYATAIAGYRSVLAGSPSPEDARTALFLLGQACHLAGDDQAAISTLEQFVAAYGDDPRVGQALFLIGAAHQALGDRLAQEAGIRDPDEATVTPSQAVQHWLKAIPAYQAYRDRQDVVADHVDLRLAQVLTNLKRQDEALAVYARIADSPTASASLKLEAWRGTGRTYRMLKDYPAAAAAYQKALAYAADDNQRAEFSYAVARAYRDADQIDPARLWWRRVIVQYPRTPHALWSLSDLADWGDVGVSWFERGLVYLYNDDFLAAIDALAREPAGSAQAGQAHYYAARAYQQLRRHADAIREFDQIIRNFSDIDLVDDAWFGKADSQYRQGRYSAAIATYRAFAAARPDDPRVPEALWRAAWATEDAAGCAAAVSAYLDGAARFPRSDYADRSRFQAGLCHYRAGRPADAIATWHRLAAGANDPAYASRAAFWAGKAELAQGDTRGGQADLARAAQLAPFNYYGLRAQALIGGAAASLPEPDPSPAAAEAWLAGWTRSLSAQVAAAGQALDNDRLYRRVTELTALGLPGEAAEEMTRLRGKVWNDPVGLYWFARRAEELGFYNLSVSAAERLARLSPAPSLYQVPAFIQRLAYPRAYAELVEPEAGRHGFDPLLFYALMRQESRFDPNATSVAFARGLTQVIPTTGRDIARSLGLRTFQVQDLYKPYLSVSFGTYYLAAQLDRFGEVPELALAAYNGGPGNARRWSATSDDLDVVIESIDIQETGLFVRFIAEQYAHYRALYGGVTRAER
jgi:soluble lytic murein transglycosylase